jgi:HAD superfamily hydrolase (TIGR01549 family)
MGDFIAHYETQKHREKIHHDVIAVLIEGKRRGFPTALVTSKNREELANTLPRLGIADCVDTAITADDVTHPKPDPEGLRLALHRSDVPPDQAATAFYIGDTVHDMAAARASGVCGVGVTWGAATRAQLEQESPAFLCDTPAELRAILFGENSP